MPGIQLVDKTVKETGPDGIQVDRAIPLLATNGTSNRVCDGCFLAQKCPSYAPESECAYDLPVEARTRDQLGRLQEVLIEIQTQRVFFARFSEEIEGGYPDPNVGNEIDRLQRMLKSKADMDAEGFSVTIKAQSRMQGESGVFGRIFGREAVDSARQLPSAVQAEDVAATMGIWDADVVESGS